MDIAFYSPTIGPLTRIRFDQTGFLIIFSLGPLLGTPALDRLWGSSTPQSIVPYAYASISPWYLLTLLRLRSIRVRISVSKSTRIYWHRLRLHVTHSANGCHYHGLLYVQYKTAAHHCTLCMHAYHYHTSFLHCLHCRAIQPILMWSV